MSLTKYWKGLIIWAAFWSTVFAGYLVKEAWT